MNKAGAFSSSLNLLNHLAPEIILIGLLSITAALTLSSFVLQPSFSSEIMSYGNNGTARSNCNCVVFRIDDIQDYWVRSAQLAAMNQFIDRNQSLTLGIIMSIIGNDTEIVNKVREGHDIGLFELAVHGWNHTDYTKMSEEEQRTSMYDANRKMSALFGNTSEIFIPPLNAFNNDTINAMQQVGMTILDANSSSFDELKLNDNSSSSSNNNNNNNELQTLSSLPMQSKNFFYVPSTIAFKDYYQDKPIKNSIQNIFNNITQSIDVHGYAVIIIHPQDFVRIDANGSLTNILDENEINDLSRLIDSILSNNIRIGSFSEIIGEAESNMRIMPSSSVASSHVIINRPTQFLFTTLSPSLNSSTLSNCSGGWEVRGDFLPSESDYDAEGINQTIPLYSLDSSNNTTTRTFNSEFLRAVEMEGWGLTREGDYIGIWDGRYWGPSSLALNSQGQPLIAGISAGTDGNTIPYGYNFTIPTLPSPWNTKTFMAVDLGSSEVGKQVNIYTGTGGSAEKDAAMITQTEANTVCMYHPSLTLHPPDPISVEGMGRPDSTIAEIYNRFGKYIYEKASEIKVSPASAAAVIYVESAGQPFGEDGRMTIKFEPCVFYEMWGSNHSELFSQYYQCDRPNDKFRESAAENFTELHGDHFREWTAFNLAQTLNEDAAMQSISMGLAQIMGFNHHKIGYPSADEMFNALSNSTKSQIDSLFFALSYRDASGKSCLDPLKIEDYVSFANCYNGEGRDEEYGSRISQAAASYKALTSNRVYPSS
jgi:peptidoglycan/xylan/chitin deacetylase (PgdA/CDA1 family)